MPTIRAPNCALLVVRPLCKRDGAIYADYSHTGGALWRPSKKAKSKQNSVNKRKAKK